MMMTRTYGIVCSGSSMGEGGQGMLGGEDVYYYNGDDDGGGLDVFSDLGRTKKDGGMSEQVDRVVSEDPFEDCGGVVVRDDKESAEEPDPLDMFGGTPAAPAPSNAGEQQQQVQKEQSTGTHVLAGGLEEEENHGEGLGGRFEDVPIHSNHTRQDSLPVFEFLDRDTGYKDETEEHRGVQGRQHAPEGHRAGEAVADIGHRAAKAIQSGTRWFLHAGKQIARDVQSKIDLKVGKRSTSRKNSGHASIIDSPKSDEPQMEEFHLVWAEQLRRESPETRAAALGAMDEIDRLAVQEILDIKEEMLQNSLFREDISPNSSPMDVDDPKPPPMYDEIVKEQYLYDEEIAEQSQTQVQHSFDLLNLDSNRPQQGTEDWENELFGGASEKSCTTANSIVTADKSKLKDVLLFDKNADEPEIRRKLREKREAQEKERVAKQLADTRERDAKETAAKEKRVIIRERIKPEINAWCSGKKDNIRSLLCTMDKVLWEGSEWKSPSVVEVMEASKVKRWYMKANLVVHPDKVKQKGGTMEELTRAEMIFDVLKSAWCIFQEKES